MAPESTEVTAPLHLRIADDLRMKIERGELGPGDPIPSAQELSQMWSCSPGSARAALALLKQQGLVDAHRGSRPVVRTPPRQTVLRQDTNQLEKDRVLLSEEERRANGAAEDGMGVSVDDLNFRSTFTRVPATAELAELFGIDVGDELLRREYETTNKTTGVREHLSVSYMPVSLISANPDILDPANEPWPGGTQHQLYTVGIEIARMDSEVTAAMPTTVEMRKWALPNGVPLLCGRRLAIDVGGRVVEVSEAKYPADRTKMMFSIALKRWESS